MIVKFSAILTIRGKKIRRKTENILRNLFITFSYPENFCQFMTQRKGFGE